MDNQRELPLFPLPTVLFPGMALPLHVFEERYKLMIAECLRDKHPFGVVLIKSGPEVGGDAVIYPVGTTAHITQIERLNDGRINVSTLGHNRFRVNSTHRQKPYLTGIVEEFPLQDTGNPQVRQAAQKVGEMLQTYLNLFATLGNVDLEMDGGLPDDSSTLAFLTAIILRTPMKEKQQLLDVPDLLTLLRVERKMLHRELHILQFLIENGPRWRDDPKPFSTN